jgi:hypothetical protein
MEDREVASIYAVAAEDVCADGIAVGGVGESHLLECSMLVCGGMSAEEVVLVDIVCICTTSSGMFGRKAKDIEIGPGGDDWIGGDIVLVGGLWEDGLDEFSCDAYRMIGLGI